MNKVVRFRFILMIIIFICVLVVSWAMQLFPLTARPKDIKLSFNQGKVVFAFIPAYTFEINKFSENVYSLDTSNSIRNYKISFYHDLNTLSNEKFYKKDSVNGAAGEGCIDQKKKFYLNNYAFWQVDCYYNPIEMGTSGQYNPQVSIVTQKVCYYQLPKQKGIIYIDGTGAEGLDLCDSIKELFKFIKIDYAW